MGPVTTWLGSSVTDARDSSVASPSAATGSCDSVSKLAARGSRTCSPSGRSSAQTSSGALSAQRASSSSSGSWPRKKARVVGAASSEPLPSPASAGGHSRCAFISEARDSSAPGMRESVPGSFAPKATDRATSATDRAIRGLSAAQALARRRGHARSARRSTRSWTSSAVCSIARAPCPAGVGDVEVPRAHELHAGPSREESPQRVGKLLFGRPRPHAPSSLHDRSQRERAVPGVGHEARDFCHLVVLHREKHVGTLGDPRRYRAPP
jgi:hypothetical protein